MTTTHDVTAAHRAVADELRAATDAVFPQENYPDGWPSEQGRLATAARAAADRIDALAAEVLALRRALAYEARVVEAHTDLKAITGSRREHLDEAVSRMRQAALTGNDPNWSQPFYSREFDNLTAGGL